MFTKCFKLLMILGVLIFAFGQSAQALSLIGPVDPNTDFPSFVQDDENVQLGPCDRVDPIEETPGVFVNNFPCPGLELDDPFGEFVDGNIAEFTYYRAEANFAPNAFVKNFRLRIEVQGGLLPPATINNAVRLVLRFEPGAPEGTYRIFHPFGVDDVVVGPDEIATRLDTELPGGVLAQAPNFDPARDGNTQCFWGNGLTTTIPGDAIYNGAVDGTGAILTGQLVPIVGNPSCPQTAADLIFGVQFPDPNGVPGGQIFSTDQFTVEGKFLEITGFVTDRSTYERNGAGTVAKADLWVSSVPLENIVVSAGTAQLINASGTRTMVEDAANPGRYFLRMRLVTPLPAAPITLSINGQEVTLVDEVRITKALHNVDSGVVDVNATSSDVFGAPTITFTDENGNDVPPILPPNVSLREITATSTAGGMDTEIVDVRGANIFLT